ncbi:MAG: SDR family oxidoreductase [Gammaproteobacteria bacterium]|nr:SDR family oxidoreductase [Gammaproteobacteria bacterium]
MRFVLTCFALALTAFISGCAASAASDSQAAPAATYVTIGDPSALSAEQPTVLITGSNRGIGLEFVEQFAERGWNIIATARKPGSAEELQALAAANPRIVVEQLDVTDFERIDALAAKYADTPIDILLSNAGIVPRYNSAFKRVDGVDWDMARRSYEVNAIAPLKLSEAFMSNVEASAQKKIVIISSKAGSFELSPKMPMMYSYRASKAGLNMFMYTLSLETKRNGVVVTMLSPGQVNTTPGMKMPGAIETDESVAKMIAVMEGLTMENNGQFLDYEDGRVLAW